MAARAVEIMNARAVALASRKASALFVVPGFAAQGADTAWVVAAIASIHANPRTEHEADALKKSLACLLAREAPAAFRGAELDLMATFDAGAKPTQPTAVYIADLELTPRACNGT